MEDLTKHQLILLVLLVTFISSIGTSIITFTLLAEAPVEVTQNISRVVEKTIERVVTEEGKPEKVVETIVVNEEDQIVEAIAKIDKSVVRFKTLSADGSTIVAGLGVVVDVQGMIVYSLANFNPATTYDLVFYDGKIYPVAKTYIDNKNGLVFVQPMILRSETTKYNFHPATLGDSSTLKVGQSLIAITGRDSNAASIGRIRQLAVAEDKITINSIFSDIAVGRSYAGSPVLNLSGNVIGLELPVVESDRTYSYLPINMVKTAISVANVELAK